MSPADHVMFLPFWGREPGVGTGCGTWTSNHNTGRVDKWVWFVGQPLGIFVNKHVWQEIHEPGQESSTEV